MIILFISHKGSKLVEILLRLFLRYDRSVLFSEIIEVELSFALGAKIIQIFDDPLSDALLMEDVLAGQHHRLFHVVVAHRASEIVELLQLFPFHLFQLLHRTGQFSDP